MIFLPLSKPNTIVRTGNPQAFSTSTTSGARPQRLGPTFEIYQNREGFKVLFLNN